MKIQITPVNKYRVTHEGVDLGEFEFVSAWEGMMKIRNEKGLTIIAEDESFLAVTTEAVLYKMSPSLFRSVKILEAGPKTVIEIGDAVSIGFNAEVKEFNNERDI